MEYGSDVDPPLSYGGPSEAHDGKLKGRRKGLDPSVPKAPEHIGTFADETHNPVKILDTIEA